VINISNRPGKGDRSTLVEWPRPPTSALVRDRSGGGATGTRVTLAVRGALDRLARFLRRLGDRWFAANDAEAHWREWQITKTSGGLGRRYRDTRFDTPGR